MDLALCKQEKFNGVLVDFYRDENNNVFMTREQIGTALEYAQPRKAIDKIHQRNKERLNKFAVSTKLNSTDGKKYDTTVYNSNGICEICRYSKQPKANLIYDWLTANILLKEKSTNITQSPTIDDYTSLVTVINNKIVVSSRQVAKNFEKEHKHVLEDISKYIKAENSAMTDWFCKTYYQAGTGKRYPMYYMTRDGFSLLVMGFTGKKALAWKVKYIKAFNAMEKMIKSNYKLPDFTNPVEAAIEWAKQYKEKEKYKKELEEAKPKAEFADAITQCKTNLPIGTFAKIVYRKTGIGRNKLFDWLRDRELLMSIPSEYNQPTQKAIRLGLFETKESIASERDIVVKVAITPKGQLYVYNMLTQYENTIVALKDKHLIA
jgi:anti-repressor protein